MLGGAREAGKLGHLHEHAEHINFHGVIVSY
jgi:hypothetical protein